MLLRPSDCQKTIISATDNREAGVREGARPAS